MSLDERTARTVNFFPSDTVQVGFFIRTSKKKLTVIIENFFPLESQ